MTASLWLTLVDGQDDHLGIVSVLYHAATAHSANDHFVWLAHVCGMTCPKISATPDFQLALLANISKCYCSLLHQTAVHLWQFDFYARFINALTYLQEERIFTDEYRRHQDQWLDWAQHGRVKASGSVVGLSTAWKSKGIRIETKLRALSGWLTSAEQNR